MIGVVIPCYDIAAAETRYRTLIPDDVVREAAGGVPRQQMTSGMYASILPAVWSFQLALRSRGLGSVLTTAHQADQPAMAEILGIPTTWDQSCLIPVAHVDGDFTRSPRRFTCASASPSRRGCTCFRSWSCGPTTSRRGSSWRRSSWLATGSERIAPCGPRSSG